MFLGKINFAFVGRDDPGAPGRRALQMQHYFLKIDFPAIIFKNGMSAKNRRSKADFAPAW